MTSMINVLNQDRFTNVFVHWSQCWGVCVCVFVHLHRCVPACIINYYSRFPSTNYSYKTLRFRVEKLLSNNGGVHSRSASPSFQWLPTDLVTCTFVAFYGLCFAFYCVDSLNWYIVKEKSIIIYRNGILRNCSYSGLYSVEFCPCELCPNVCI